MHESQGDSGAIGHDRLGGYGQRPPLGWGSGPTLRDVYLPLRYFFGSNAGSNPNYLL